MKKTTSILLALLLAASLSAPVLAAEPLYYSVSSESIELDDNNMVSLQIIVEGSVAYAGMQFELVPGPNVSFALNATEAAADNTIYIRSVSYNQGNSSNYSALQHSFDGESVFFYIANTGQNSFSDIMECTLTLSYNGDSNASFIIAQIKEQIIFGTGDINETVTSESITITLLTGEIEDNGNSSDNETDSDIGTDAGGTGGGIGGGGGGSSANTEAEIVVEESETPLTQAVWVDQFADVTSADWFYDAVKYVYENALMNGVGDTEFAPNSPLTRAMLVTILHRYEGEPSATATNPFSDVPSGQWYTDAIIWASENELVEGYGNGLFGTNDNITREQVATILMRFATWKSFDVSKTNELSGYTDASEISDWALNAMKWANAENLITGRTETSLVPKGNTTRAEAAILLMRFIEDFM